MASITVAFTPGQWSFITPRPIDDLPQKLTKGATFEPQIGYCSTSPNKDLVEFVNNDWYTIKHFKEGTATRSDRRIPPENLNTYGLGYWEITDLEHPDHTLFTAAAIAASNTTTPKVSTPAKQPIFPPPPRNHLSTP